MHSEILADKQDLDSPLGYSSTDVSSLVKYLVA
jgi:hypothetical protein